MKILVISHSCAVAVNQQVYVDLAALPDTEVVLVLPSRWKSEYSGEIFAPRLLPTVQFSVYEMPIMRPGSVNLHFYQKLPLAEMRKWRPDVVLASQEPYSLSGGQALWLAKRTGARFAFQTNQNLLKRYPPPFSFIESACFRQASVGLAYSEEARQVMVSKGRRGPTEVIPYFTDTRLFAPTPLRASEAAALRESLGLENAVVIGYMGRLVAEKGLGSLLEAVVRLPAATNSGQAVKVLLVGSGASEDDLRAQARERGIADRVIFAGLVPHDKAGDYLACMDIFALPSLTTPSWKEQFGRVIIEALASGVPVVGSDSGEIPNLLRATGGGLVFAEGNAEELAARLGELIASPARRSGLAAAGGAAVNERYTSEAVARRLRDVLAA